MKFEWDENKNHSNEAKHGVSFAEAMTIFGGDYWEIQDHSSNEERFKAIGFSKKTNVLVVVYCYRGEDSEVIRIISARKATSKEEEAYAQQK